MLRFLKKWFYCSWYHRTMFIESYDRYSEEVELVKVGARCYPIVWEKDSKSWYCMVCEPCSAGIPTLEIN